MKDYFTWSFIVLISVSTSLQAQDFAWAKGMGSRGSEYSYGIVVDDEGNAYSVGRFSQTVDFDPGPDSFPLTTNGIYDIYISKLDSDGDFVWAKQIGGQLSDGAFAIALDPSGYLYLTGNFRDTVDFDPSPLSSLLYGRKLPESFLAKFDFDGNLIWARQVTRGLDTLGRNVGYSVSIDPEGNPYVIGNFGDSADFDPGIGEHILTSEGGDDIFLVKYDAAGNYTWAKGFGGPENQDPYGMALDHQGNIFCTGTFDGEADFDPGPLTHLLTAQDSSSDAFILKLTSSGEFLWAKQVSGPYFEYSNGITVDQNGNCYTSGSCTKDTDFNYGSTPKIKLPPFDDIDGYLFSLDANGKFRWVKGIGGFNHQEAWGITSSPGPKGALYATGFFYDEAIVGELDSSLLAIKGGIDVFMCKLDFEGNFKYLIGIGGSGAEISLAIAVNSSGPDVSIYSTGYFYGTCDFDPGMNNFSLTSKGVSDLYVVKLNDLMTGVENPSTKNAGLDIQIYPNPSNSEIQIHTPGITATNIKLTNSLGIEVQSFETFIENEILHLDVSILPNGTYFLQLYLNEKIVTKKIMVLH